LVACVKYQTRLTWGGYRVKTPFSNLVTVLSYKEKGYMLIVFDFRYILSYTPVPSLSAR
jgi:hypothetical protein